MAELSNWIAETSREEGENIEELSQDEQDFLNQLADDLFGEGWCWFHLNFQSSQM